LYIFLIHIYHDAMSFLPLLGVILGIALLLLAIPQIDVTRSAVAAAVSSPIGAMVSVLFLVLTVFGLITALVFTLGGRA